MAGRDGMVPSTWATWGLNRGDGGDADDQRHEMKRTKWFIIVSHLSAKGYYTLDRPPNQEVREREW